MSCGGSLLEPVFQDFCVTSAGSVELVLLLRHFAGEWSMQTAIKASLNFEVKSIYQYLGIVTMGRLKNTPLPISFDTPCESQKFSKS